MKMEVKLAIAFAGGVLSGAGAMYLALNKFFRKRSEDEIKSVEKAFTERIQEVEEERDNALGVAKKAVIENGSNEKKDEVRSEALENSTVMNSIINGMSKDKVDYSTYYPDDHPQDDEPEEDVSEVINTVNNKRSDRKYAKIISYDDYGSLPGYDYKELYYYQGDDTLVDDQEDIIDNPELLLGDALTKYGFKTSDERTIYVRNEDFSCDYEITKVFQRFTDGMDLSRI